jgi:putative ABC transport system substrate-binding protein
LPSVLTTRLTPGRTRLAANALGFKVSSIELTAPGDLEVALTAVKRANPDALLILTDEALNAARYPRIVAFAMQEHLPTILGEPTYALAGGFIAYGPSGTELWRRAAIYIDKILKGANPADLPVEQPTKFELVINLKTAKALGLTIPPSLLQRADQVIE